jgi:hypothetical protein
MRIMKGRATSHRARVSLQTIRIDLREKKMKGESTGITTLISTAPALSSRASDPLEAHQRAEAEVQRRVESTVTYKRGASRETSSSKDSISIPTAHQHELGVCSPAMQ